MKRPTVGTLALNRERRLRFIGFVRLGVDSAVGRGGVRRGAIRLLRINLPETKQRHQGKLLIARTTESHISCCNKYGSSPLEHEQKPV